MQRVKYYDPVHLLGNRNLWISPAIAIAGRRKLLWVQRSTVCSTDITF
jgi:hypothetical protein